MNVLPANHYIFLKCHCSLHLFWEKNRHFCSGLFSSLKSTSPSQASCSTPPPVSSSRTLIHPNYRTSSQEGCSIVLSTIDFSFQHLCVRLWASELLKLPLTYLVPFPVRLNKTFCSSFRGGIGICRTFWWGFIKFLKWKLALLNCSCPGKSSSYKRYSCNFYKHPQIFKHTRLSKSPFL